MIIRMIPTSFDVPPKKADVYLVVKREADKMGTVYGLEYTPEGGWNSCYLTDGSCYSESAFTAEDMKSYKYWLRPVPVNEDSYAERLAVILDEVSEEKRATEPTPGDELGKYEFLDELETYLVRALEFAEDLEA